MNLWNDVVVGASRTLERHIEFYRYKNLTKAKFVGRKTCVV